MAYRRCLEVDVNATKTTAALLAQFEPALLEYFDSQWVMDPATGKDDEDKSKNYEPAVERVMQQLVNVGADLDDKFKLARHGLLPVGGSEVSAGAGAALGGASVSMEVAGDGDGGASVDGAASDVAEGLLDYATCIKSIKSRINAHKNRELEEWACDDVVLR